MYRFACTARRREIVAHASRLLQSRTFVLVYCKSFWRLLPAEFDATLGQFPSGLPHPEGAQQIKSASQNLTIARKALMKAHNRLSNYQDRGIVPEDLKRSG
jgi:hypothetical protein